MNKFLTNLRKITIFILLFSLFLDFTVQQVCAAEKQYIEIVLEGNNSISTGQVTRIPNVIIVRAEKVSDNKVKLFVSNTGIDVFDSVTCSVKIIDYKGITQYNKPIEFTNINPFIH